MSKLNTRAVALFNAPVGTIYATATGVKIGTRGKVAPPAEVLRTFPKGDRRRIRKAARRVGAFHVATA